MRSTFLSVFNISGAEWLAKSLPVCACNIFTVAERSGRYDETLLTHCSPVISDSFCYDDLHAVFRSWSVTV
jgi:hypothetical protein